jgi:hypothetical protein
MKASKQRRSAPRVATNRTILYINLHRRLRHCWHVGTALLCEYITLTYPCLSQVGRVAGLGVWTGTPGNGLIAPTLQPRSLRTSFVSFLDAS